jgi:hypothetical protein
MRTTSPDIQHGSADAVPWLMLVTEFGADEVHAVRQPDAIATAARFVAALEMSAYAVYVIFEHA